MDSGILNQILRGGLLSHQVIRRLSFATNTPTRYWYYMQTRWQFFQYAKQRKGHDTISRIVPARVVDVRSLGSILESNFVRPIGRSHNELEKLLNLKQGTFFRLFKNGSQINDYVACVLARNFKTSVKYWFDIQTRHEIFCLLKETVNLNKGLVRSINEYIKKTPDPSLSAVGRRAHSSPGRTLIESFMQPSGISISEWCVFLGITKEFFDGLVSGKRVMSFDLILKVSKIFKTEVSFWIESQNIYRSSEAMKIYSEQLKELPGHLDIFPTKELHPLHPMEFLRKKFLYPMGIPMAKFYSHIKANTWMRSHTRRRLKQFKRIDFELAMRIGEALNMDPMYWVNLQLEHDILEFENTVGRQADEYTRLTHCLRFNESRNQAKNRY